MWASSVRAGLAQRARIVLLASEGCATPRSPSGRGIAADGECVAVTVCRCWYGRAGRCGPARSTQDGRPAEDHR